MIDLMRLMSIFGNLGGVGQEQPNYRTPPFVPQQSQPTFGGSYQDFTPPNPYAQPQQQGYQPTMTMQDKFMELIQGFPQRDANPSGWRKIGALLTGLGGENAGEAMQLSNTALNLPFINKVQDWGIQVKPTMEAAENERLYNQYEQTRILNQQKADELEAYRRDQLKRQEERDKVLADQGNERLRQGDQRLHIQQQAQTLREWKAANPGWEFVNDTSTGKVVAINKADPSQVRQTGVNHGDLSDVQKFEIGLKTDKDLAAFRGEIESGLIAERGDEARQTAAERERLLQTRPPTARSGGSNNLEETRRVTNRLQQMGIERPDLFRYIQNGTIKSGTPDNIRAEINQYVYGETRVPALSNVPFKPVGTTSQPGGMVRMRDPQGNIRMIPADKVEEAKKRGAVEVK